MKKKQKWGMWQILQGKMLNGVPIRIMFQLPYDWHVTRRYWAKYRLRKRKAGMKIEKALSKYKPRDEK